MAKTRNSKPYRFVEASGRPIQCIFAHIPGKRFSTGTYDRDEAVAWALEFLRNDGIPQEGMPTLREFAKDFFIRTDPDSIQSRYTAFDKSMNPTWAKDRQNRLDTYIMPKFGTYLLDAITPRNIENWIGTLQGVRVRKLANSTKNNVLQTFKLVMDDAVRKEYIKVNPLTQVMRPSASATAKPRRVFTLYEQELLFPDNPLGRITIWETLQWATFFSIMYDTGFRPGEVGGLQVGDIYQTPNGMAIFTNHSVNAQTRRPMDRVKTSGKGVENRVGLLSPITAELVKAHMNERKLYEADEFIFRTTKNGYMSASCSCLHFNKIMEKHGIENSVEYCFRHTFLTYRRGEIDEQTLAMAMGHTGGGPRDDYDHRNAEILIAQLEKKRGDIFRQQEEPKIVPLYKNKA